MGAMKRCHDEHGYLPCPHTAIGLHYSFSNTPPEGVRRAVIATAAPHKFPEAIEASGIRGYVAPPAIAQLHQLDTKYEEMRSGQDWYSILADKIRVITALRS